MRTSAHPSSLDSASAHDPEAEVTALLDQIVRMVAVSQALVSSQRSVELAGLKDLVGLLCAKALDLPPSRTGFLKLELKRLAASLDLLNASMRENAA